MTPCCLCGYGGATIVNEELVILVICQPCGGSYAITYAAADAWLVGSGASKTVALELARQHLAKLRHFVPMPQIQTDDVMAWVKPPS
jgi:hypothetical protein